MSSNTLTVEPAAAAIGRGPFARSLNNHDGFGTVGGRIGSIKPRTEAANTFAAVSVPTWTDDAGCRDMNPESFFPSRGVRGKAVTNAVAVCAGCPVAAMCAARAIDAADDGIVIQGIWAGIVFGWSCLNNKEFYRRKLDQLRAVAA